MHKIVDIAVIGAGASGLMFASLVCDKFDVVVLDSNDTFAPKLKISGGGKCNATNINVSSKNFLGDDEFVSSVLKQFSNTDLVRFFEKNGLKLNQVDRVVKGQLFANSSSQIIDIFKNLTKKANFIFEAKVEDAKITDDIFEITYNKTDKLYAKNLVIACGGPSYPVLNASDIGYKIAQNFGHKIITPKPALVGFTAQKDEFWFKELSGVSLEAKITIGERSFEGGFLFTHKGMSGPVILNSSLWWEKGQISIDFLPKIENIATILKSNQNKIISTAIPLPKNFMKAFLQKIELEDKKISSLNYDEIAKLELLKNYRFAPAGNFGFSKAEVTKGGVSTNEINNETMQSKIIKNLYFLGEVLDVTGELGGYNLQWAFSSAQICGYKFK